MDIEGDGGVALQIAHESGGTETDHEVEGGSRNAPSHRHLPKAIRRDRLAREHVTQRVPPREQRQTQQRRGQLGQQAHKLQQIDYKLSKQGQPDQAH